MTDRLAHRAVHAGRQGGPGQPPDVRFTCPVAGVDVAWAAKDAFNPGAVVHDGRVHMLFRGEDTVGRFGGTSRIGLAVSDDGLTFTVDPQPVLFPDDDPWQPWEWPGGCEDPRVVESPDGGFVATYTAFDGKVGRLFVATSDDLRHWNEAGARLRIDALCAALVEEWFDRDRGAAAAASWRHASTAEFWMYWGEGTCFAATSEDLVRWTPIDFDATRDRYLSYDRVGRPALGHPRRTGAARAPADLVSPATTVRLAPGRTRATGPVRPRTGSS